MAKSATSRKSKTKASKSKMKSAKRTKIPARKKAKKTSKKMAKKTTKKVAKKVAKKTAKKATGKKVVIKKAPIKITRASTPTTVATTIVAPEVATTPRIQAGDAAPDFTLNNQEGQPVSLSSYRGKKVVLYFYPKDDTPGCTKEACSFRDNIGFIDSSDAVILGVSFDDQTSHQKFIEKYGLNFQLLSDLEKATAKDYGVYVQKNMYGNLSWGIERSTFVIDREGKIASAFRKVSVDGHTEEVLEALKSIH